MLCYVYMLASSYQVVCMVWQGASMSFVLPENWMLADLLVLLSGQPTHLEIGFPEVS